MEKPTLTDKQKKGLIIFSDEDEFEPRPFDHRLLGRLLAYLKPYQWQVAFMVAMALVAIAAALVLPYLLKLGIDKYIANRDLKGLGLLALLYAGVALFQYLGLLFQGLTMIKVGQQAIFDLRQDLFQHIQRLSLSFFDRQKAGRIMLRVTSDVNSLEELLTSGVTTAFADSLTLVGLLGVMLWVDWRLSLVVFLTLPLIIWVAVFLRHRMLNVSRQIRRKLSAVNANLNESLMGIRVTQAFGREQVNAGLFKDINEEHYQAAKKFVPLNAFFWPWTGFLNTVGTASVLMAGGFMTLYGLATLGTIAAFMNYINRFFQPIQNLSNLFNVISTAMASCERIFELRDYQPVVADPPEPLTCNEIQGNVTFEKVSFAYNNGEIVLEDFNLQIKAGEMVAIVGPTGAGKTTIVNLLSRFYDPTAGKVIVDQMDLRFIAQEEYRKQISVVLQDTFIFSGTIAENISYGKPGASRAEIEEVAKTVGVDRYIASLPDGYETRIHERGSSLSMGQRQLIAFARALLRNPRILILDEATSSIDTHTELELQAALAKLFQNRTSFVIAHRLSTIRKADRIIVIAEGRIVETGDHETLLEQAGIYASLCERQYNEKALKREA